MPAEQVAPEASEFKGCAELSGNGPVNAGSVEHLLAGFTAARLLAAGSVLRWGRAVRLRCLPVSIVIANGLIRHTNQRRQQRCPRNTGSGDWQGRGLQARPSRLLSAQMASETTPGS